MKSSTIEIIEEVNSSPLIDSLTLSLVITEECNLSCSYCYQGDRKKGTISMVVAKNAVKEYLAVEDEFRCVTIELIGGEVMIHWDFVKELIEWTADNTTEWKKCFHYFIDTNGTLLDDEKKKWLQERKIFVTLGLSLDGSREAHNINRCNSYDKVAPHIDFITKTWPDQTVKMTISKETVPMIAEGIISLAERGIKAQANVPLEVVWGNEEEKEKVVVQFKKEIEKLVDYYSEHSELEIPSIIDLPIQTLTSRSDKERPWCGSGRSMVAIDIDGKKLPCNRYAKTSFNHDLFDKKVEAGESNCLECYFKPACQSCECNNWEEKGNPNVPTDHHCEFIKLQIWGTALIRYHRISSYVNKIIKNDTDTQIKVLGHLRGIEAVLARFEEGKPLREVGITGSKVMFIPPTKPAWSRVSLDELNK